MGTELLKEQYNLLLNDQKNKLQRLREKKQQSNNTVIIFDLYQE